jgi:hypothetical protein
VQAKVRAFYEMDGHGVGGALHMVLDDGNLEDSHIHYCRQTASTGQWHDGKRFICICNVVPCEAAVEIADDLLAMTMTQRRKVYSGWHRKDE